ncbi:hypothetical protein DEU56DRAFT_934379 [Suillus clintonianus]|uniref:uncharacterized protein n=1 Tax=Suillus clintonianus TaxID=1904413 RepID=UPI001B87B0D7|nr:uncharacterized protein DEU56DRAFT_934379 [Suillus clintonianus]KAG2145155.1 hypothetical protein DEU56DRAFT_934379 [Suillus clintonianus]
MSVTQQASSSQISLSATTPQVSPSKDTFPFDCLRIVGNFRRGATDKTNAFINLCERASKMGQGELGEPSASSLVAPYHRMLDTIEKEIVSIRGQNSGDKEQALEDGDQFEEEQESEHDSSSDEFEAVAESETVKSYTDSEDGEPSRKKSRDFKLDFSNLSHPTVTRRAKKLSRSLRKTNAILANWAHDPKRVKRKWLESPFVPEFPESELYNIIRGRVVNFDVVFSGWYSDEPEQDCEEKVGKVKIKVVGGAEPAKSIRGSQDWHVAYSLFAAAMLFAFPHRQDEIFDYQNYIHQKFAKKQSGSHSKIIAFDRAVRKRVSRRRDLELSDFSQFTDLYESHCMPDGVNIGDDSNSSGGKRKRSSREYCKRWNFGNCSRSAATCNYKHACVKCNSTDHNEKNCDSRSS